MQEKRDANQVHATETVGYLAWSPTQALSDPNQEYILHSRRFEVGKTPAMVDENFYLLGFASSFVDPPLMVLDMQTANGCDPSNLRWRNKSGDGVEVAVTEDIPEDHLEAESVGYVALTCENCDPGAPPGGGGTAAAFRVTREGDVFADRAYYCGLPSGCFNTGSGADLAERIDVSEPVEPGDVVEIDPERPGRYRKARGPHSDLVAGVIATSPGITLANRPDELERLPEHRQTITSLRTIGVRPLLDWEKPRVSVESLLKAKVKEGWLARLVEHRRLEQVMQRIMAQWPGRPLLALMGRVHVKATTENGPIRVGDLLTTASVPGYAMRCPAPKECEGAIVGKALEPLDEGEGIIEILLIR
jgi:hypothetical protein